mmetsp:Transcript_28710/g.49014  ORF Transcript_28710/g.49014 Transcript_28710/m.49014 type:complete len:252 (+) Transcript_28710:262-1017(+)
MPPDRFDQHHAAGGSQPVARCALRAAPALDGTVRHGRGRLRRDVPGQLGRLLQRRWLLVRRGCRGHQPDRRRESRERDTRGVAGRGGRVQRPRVRRSGPVQQHGQHHGRGSVRDGVHAQRQCGSGEGMDGRRGQRGRHRDRLCRRDAEHTRLRLHAGDVGAAQRHRLREHSLRRRVGHRLPVRASRLHGGEELRWQHPRPVPAECLPPRREVQRARVARAAESRRTASHGAGGGGGECRPAGLWQHVHRGL